jgi:hypothetical protein
MTDKIHISETETGLRSCAIAALFLGFGALATGCAPTPSMLPMTNYAYGAPWTYRPAPVWQGSAPDNPARDTPPPVQSEPTTQQPTTPITNDSTATAGLEDTAGWWRMGGILWTRMQEPIP